MAQPPVCDYEGSDYQTRFWRGQGREYEDRVERLALRRLMPPAGTNLIDVGAGFGRLADEFDRYQRVVLFDFSRSLLREAQNHLGGDPRFLYVAGNWYEMPFVSGLFDTLVQVRTIHHAANVPALFRELARIARPAGCYVLEFANKHNLKAILRYWLGRQAWSPFALEPVEFVELNFDFHPRWIRRQLQAAGFTPGRALAVSFFRLPLLKSIVPTGLLVALDRLVQPAGRWWPLTPSLFIRSLAAPAGPVASPGAFFACPRCHAPLGEVQAGRLVCPNPACGRHWRVDNGLYDFKEPARE
ncbi:MAG: methyltransferase domain-containing protein [Chloroflexi bacterium]|nr:methyltransferase domain-containing protein [Chloroflexota bacterium]MCI0647737.1 methyltransferase domain-containing protein [Chloroflexota bacterium]MCI0731601.1 methyltransferase domain-containing protein [Chloroflexota bacterium]